MEIKEVTVSFKVSKQDQEIDVFEMVEFLKQVDHFNKMHIEEDFASLENTDSGYDVYIDTDEVEFTFNRWESLQIITKVQMKEDFQELFFVS